MNASDRRGQVVLLAALALAVVLVPLVFAYLQLGFHADIDRQSLTAPETDAERSLDRAVHNATSGLASEYDWDERDDAIETLQDRLQSPIRELEQSRLPDGVSSAISYNESHAVSDVDDVCKDGPDRQFGPCESSDGVVVQERDGRTHVLAVAFDITVTTPDGSSHLTTSIHIRT